MQEIKVEVKQHYGTERIYPKNYSVELAQLTGKKTIDRSDIESLKNMGFTFKDITNRGI